MHKTCSNHIKRNRSLLGIEGLLAMFQVDTLSTLYIIYILVPAQVDGGAA